MGILLILTKNKGPLTSRIYRVTRFLSVLALGAEEYNSYDTSISKLRVYPIISY